MRMFACFQVMLVPNWHNLPEEFYDAQYRHPLVPLYDSLVVQSAEDFVSTITAKAGSTPRITNIVTSQRLVDAKVRNRAIEITSEIVSHTTCLIHD